MPTLKTELALLADALAAGALNPTNPVVSASCENATAEFMKNIKAIKYFMQVKSLSEQMYQSCFFFIA